MANRLYSATTVLLVGSFGSLDRRRVGLDAHDGLFERLALREDVDGVAVRLRHLLPVGARHLRPLVQPLHRHREHLDAEGVVEVAGHVARHLQVLHLILADGHDVRAVDEDVGGHQDGVGEQADAGGDALVELVLVRGRPLEQPHAGDGGENPCQFGHLGHVGLAEEGGLVGVEAQGQVIQGDIADLARAAARPAFRVGLEVADGGQGVVVGDEIEALALVLQLDVLLDGAEVVAQVQLARGLHAAEDALSHVRSFSALAAMTLVPLSARIRSVGRGFAVLLLYRKRTGGGMGTRNRKRCFSLPSSRRIR